jgi:Helix-turn-helix domain
MKLDASDFTELRLFISEAVKATLAQLEADDARLPTDRIGYSEAEAAGLLGLQRHQLRDARLRGEITARRIGKGYRYGRAALVRFLEGHQ